MSDRYVAEHYRGGRWFVIDTQEHAVVTDQATNEATAKATAANMNADAAEDEALMHDRSGDPDYSEREQDEAELWDGRARA